MPVVAAAVCPHPPLLVPEVATGAASELDDLRAACLTAVDGLAGADSVLVVGTGRTGAYDGATGGGFGAYGAPSVRFGSGAPVLPLSLAVGGWLLEQSKAAALPRSYLAVDAVTTPGDALASGRKLAAGEERVGLLVMGDGAPRRSEHSPVHLHPRAEVFDRTVAEALRTADAEVLAALDPGLAGELQAAGRAPWQVLAGALGALQGELLYDAAPYGVGYFVARFS
ncbi:hypothetical protein HPO96_25150 [Kribbella sandramycini]|uniref:Catalytic LigB subunit of aromatic ring-opening dioxygenase n=1 Tax=Kribbella sandramycini TaxID=60450 RepID=A0A7Y4L3B6_9ACTN|nr:class III extradiol dioxygenase subunit B-like domain-containing protein [Kribbella sandramycini]MBB6571054.1 hypothetical protein [Kribbella sandramycini]NOL43537.1 hypothetical protein [Kribbella sandramycini]